MGDRELPRARSFTQGPILNSSIRIHLEVSFITVTPGGSPKEGDLCNSALEIEERLFHDRKHTLQVRETGFCRAGLKEILWLVTSLAPEHTYTRQC